MRFAQNKKISGSLCKLYFLTVLWNPVVLGNEKIEAQIDEIFHEFAVPGWPSASVGVFYKNKLIFSKSYGLENLKTNQPASMHTLYNLSSNSKAITAMGIMILVDRGQLKFEDTLEKIFPAWPAFIHKVTIRQLLNHTAGMKPYWWFANKECKGYLTDKKALELVFQDGALEFSSGSQYHYSNTNYVILGQIIEKISGLSFKEFINTHIFKFLGMKNSFVHQKSDPLPARRAVGYKTVATILQHLLGFVENDFFVAAAPPVKKPTFVPFEADCASYVLADGRMFSSVADLALLERALSQPVLVKKEILEQAFSPARLNDNTLTEYGFGWKIDRLYGLKRVFHGGAHVGFRSSYMRFPEKQLSAVVLTNWDEAYYGALARKTLRVFLNALNE